MSSLKSTYLFALFMVYTKEAILYLKWLYRSSRLRRKRGRGRCLYRLNSRSKCSFKSTLEKNTKISPWFFFVCRTWNVYWSVPTPRNLPCSEKFLVARIEVNCKKAILKNFANFTGKDLCQGLFLNKVTDCGLQLY